MKILWLTWKDRQNPLAGGAELVNEELGRRLAADGHKVTFVVGSFGRAKKEEVVDGYRVIRVGNWRTVSWHAFWHYRKHLCNWPDLVIDEINTLPFFACFYVKKPVILFVHQLARQVWFYQLPLLAAAVGYFLEPAYLWLLRKNRVITVSQSTKQDLLRFGFNADKIKIISEGIAIEPARDLAQIKKYPKPTILSLNLIRPMKRTHHIVRAFEIAKEKIKDLQLLVAGEAVGGYGKKVLKMIARSSHHSSIEYLGRVSEETKIEILQKSHLVCIASVKEGWSLVVTEAASQGTPAVAYNIDGVRDSIKNNQTGILCGKNTPQNLAKNIVSLLHDREYYRRLQYRGWQLSRKVNFEKSYRQFVRLVKNKY